MTTIAPVLEVPTPSDPTTPTRTLRGRPEIPDPPPSPDPAPPPEPV